MTAAAMTAPRMQAKFVEGSLFRHIVVMSLTSSVELMAIFGVDLINMIYISWLGDPAKTAAAGYAAAVLFFTTSFGIGLAIGLSALVAQAVGMHDLELARSRATSGMVLGVGSGTVAAWLAWRIIERRSMARRPPPFSIVYCCIRFVLA